MVLFDISSEGSCKGATCVSGTRHHGTSSYRPTYGRIELLRNSFPFSPDPSRLCAFLSKLSQVLCYDNGRVTPSTRAYILRWRKSYSLHSSIFPQSSQDQPGDWRSSVGHVVVDVKTNMLGLVIINVKKNIGHGRHGHLEGARNYSVELSIDYK